MKTANIKFSFYELLLRDCLFGCLSPWFVAPYFPQEKLFLPFWISSTKKYSPF